MKPKHGILNPRKVQVSYDVQNFYPSIPIRQSIKVVRKREETKKGQKITKNGQTSSQEKDANSNLAMDTWRFSKVT